MDGVNGVLAGVWHRCGKWFYEGVNTLQLSTRQRQIVLQLLNAEGVVTSKQLAEAVAVSIRTVKILICYATTTTEEEEKRSR